MCGMSEIMLKIAICDDEAVYRESTEKECLEYFQTKKKEIRTEKVSICTFSSGKEIIESGEEYDILLLDVEMPENDGICVKEYLEKTKKRTRVIFLTSHAERVLEAFGKNVLCFLRKPLDKADFRNAMNKAVADIGGEVLEIEENGETFLIPVNEIRYVEARDKYTIVFMEDKNLTFRKTMKFWENELPEQDFCRIQKSYLVNWEFFVKEKEEVVLEKNKRVKISRKNKDEIMERYKGYLRRRAEEM